MPKSFGFTLVELLVSITIMGILGTVGFIEYRTFSASQALNEGISNVQNLLRTGQTNATTGVRCLGSSGATWTVRVESDLKTINLRCSVGNSISTVKSYNLPQDVQTVSASGCTNDACSSPCSLTLPFSVNFTQLDQTTGIFGTTSFADGAGTGCLSTQNIVRLTITHTKSNESKNITVSKGGRIDAEK